MSDNTLNTILMVIGSLLIGAYIQFMRSSSRNKDIQLETKEEVDEAKKNLKGKSLRDLVDDFNKRRERYRKR